MVLLGAIALLSVIAFVWMEARDYLRHKRDSTRLAREFAWFKSDISTGARWLAEFDGVSDFCDWLLYDKEQRPGIEQLRERLRQKYGRAA